MPIAISSPVSAVGVKFAGGGEQRKDRSQNANDWKPGFHIARLDGWGAVDIRNYCGDRARPASQAVGTTPIIPVAARQRVCHRHPAGDFRQSTGRMPVAHSRPKGRTMDE